MVEMKEKLKDLQIKFVGDLDWLKLRDLMVLKMIECRNEEEFIFLIKAILGSMFSNSKEINKARKILGKELLTDIEKRDIDKFVKNGENKQETAKI